MTLAERLKTIRGLSGNDQKTMAEQLGISFRSWQDYELGKSVPGGKVFEALAKMGYDANWLLTGEGAIKKMAPTKPFYKKILAGEVTMSDEAPNQLQEEHRTTNISNDPGEGFVHIPRYEVAASAGGGSMIHSEQIVDHLSFKADWVHNALGVPVTDLALINVTGDSMEPTLSEGDLILIDMSYRGVKDNAVYVLQLNGSLLVKRIQHKLDGSVVVKSDNAIYEPERIESEAVDSLNVIGRVVWCGRRM